MLTKRNSWLRAGTLAVLGLGLAYGAQSFTEKEEVKVERKADFVEWKYEGTSNNHLRLLMPTIILSRIDFLWGPRRQSVVFQRQKTFKSRAPGYECSRGIVNSRSRYSELSIESTTYY
jgi:hypothetical protein